MEKKIGEHILRRKFLDTKKAWFNIGMGLQLNETKTKKVFVDSLMTLHIGPNHYNQMKLKNYTNHKDLVY